MQAKQLPSGRLRQAQHFLAVIDGRLSQAWVLHQLLDTGGANDDAAWHGLQASRQQVDPLLNRPKVVNHDEHPLAGQAFKKQLPAL